MAGFSFRRNIDGSAYVPSLMYAIGKNSVAFTVGDAVRINTSGFVDICDAAEGIAGFVQGVVTRKKKAKTADTGYLAKYTMTSDNQTVAKDMIAFIPALPHYLFYNDADGSLDESYIGMYYDLVSKSQINASSRHDTTQETTRLWEVDPDGDGDLSKGLFQVVESQFGADSWDREA